MCSNCGINHDTNELENQEAFDAFLSRLFDGFGPVEPTDYFAEYRTESEYDVTGTDEVGDWKISVAKVGGGTVGKEYPTGEQWLFHAYRNGELTDSMLGTAPEPMTHVKAAEDGALGFFGVTL